MKFDVFFTIRGPGGVIEAPNTSNPIECENIDELLGRLEDETPYNATIGIETVGLRIVLAKETPDASGG